MPRHNSVESLSNIAMAVIVDNFEYLCYGVRNSNALGCLLSDEGYLQIDHRFQHLPAPLCQQLQNVIGSKCGYLRRHHLHALLHKYQKEFTFSETGDLYSAVQWIADRCPNLTSVNMSYLRHISVLSIIDILTQMRHLTSISLVKTAITNQVLCEIGKNCKELQTLDISNTNVTGEGIVRLCYDKEYRKARCSKLNKLIALGCLIAPDSMWFLLTKIPTLRELEYENTFGAVACGLNEDFQNNIHMSSPQCLSLAYLTSPANEFIDEAEAEFVMAKCPSLTSITLHGSIVENEVLYKAMSLEHLSHLRLTNDEDFTMDFYEGVLPLLTVKGTYLRSLILSKFTAVDLTAIGNACPLLEKLALSEICIYEEVVCPNKTLFTNLKAIEIWSSLTQDSVSSVVLKQLLCYCPGIQNILISNSTQFGDSLLHAILETNSVRELERLTLDSSPLVTNSSLETLLNMNNNLTFLRVWNCFHINKKHEANLNQRIKDENLDLFFEWYP